MQFCFGAGGGRVLQKQRIKQLHRGIRKMYRRKNADSESG
jgi:hypothetical protein